MTINGTTVLLIVAVVLFVLAAFGVVWLELTLGWLGLAFFAASFVSRS